MPSKVKQQEFPGVSHYRDRHGKLRWRYRNKGFTCNLGTEYGSPDFIKRYTAAVKGERLRPTSGEATGRSSQAPLGSLSHVIESWYTSPDFTKLGKTTQTNYKRVAERLREEHGHRSVKDLSQKHVKMLMQRKAATPEAANMLLRILRLILDHAKDFLEVIDHNPARDVKKYSPNNPEGYHTWTEEEIARFFDRHPVGTLAYDAMVLMLYTGASRADAVQLGPDNLREGRLQYRRQKMKTRQGVLVDIPIHPALQEVIDRNKDKPTFLHTQQRKPRSPNGLGNLMRAWCDEAGLPECTSHGLRKACARRLAEAGASPHEIMAVTGHKTLKEVERYTEKVLRAGLADRAWKRLED